MVRQNAFKIRCWAGVFGLESEVTTEGSCAFFCYDHANSMARNTQLLCMPLCSNWLSRSDIPEILPLLDNHGISLELY